MRLLTPTRHGWADYLTVAVLALAPPVVGLEGVAVTACWVLAVVHLLLTVTTAFPPGLVPVVPLNVHGVVEVLVGVVLALGAAVVGAFTDVLDGRGTLLLVVIGLVILLVWALTEYGTAPPGPTPREL